MVPGLLTTWKFRVSNLGQLNRRKGRLGMLIHKNVKKHSKNGRLKRSLKSSLRNYLLSLLWTITCSISMRRKLNKTRKNMNPNNNTKTGSFTKSNSMCKAIRWIRCPNKTNKVIKKRDYRTPKMLSKSGSDWISKKKDTIEKKNETTTWSKCRSRQIKTRRNKIESSKVIRNMLCGRRRNVRGPFQLVLVIDWPDQALVSSRIKSMIQLPLRKVILSRTVWTMI